MKYLYIMLGCIIFAGCVHTNLDAKKENQPDIDLPSWVNQDCFLSNGYYYFVGYGEGQNASSAVRNALITSRQNALTCLFGGTVTSKITVDEKNQSIDFSGHTSVTLSYEHVNWSGYEQVSGKVFYASKERNKLYSHYRWSQKSIELEQERLKKLSEKIDETQALKNEVSLKKEIIEDQKEKLAELQQQEQELKAIKSQSEKAVTRLKALNEARHKKERDILSIINNMYCGITVEKFIELFREPDHISLPTSGGYGYIDGVHFYWDQFLVKVSYKPIRSALGDWPKRGEADTAAIRIAKREIIDFVYTNYGKTNRGYNLCKG